MTDRLLVEIAWGTTIVALGFYAVMAYALWKGMQWAESERLQDPTTGVEHRVDTPTDASHGK